MEGTRQPNCRQRRAAAAIARPDLSQVSTMTWLSTSTWFPVALALTTLAGCRGEDLTFDCENQAMAFIEREDAEAPPLVAPIPEDGPVPVTVSLTEEGVNRLLKAAILDNDTPFSGDIPIVTANAKFEPEGDPTIEFASVNGCPSCVLFNVDFAIELSNAGDPVSSGVGNVQLAIPLFLESDEATGTTRLFADYSKTTIEDMYLQVFGFDSEEHTSLAGALEILLQERIQENFMPIELLSIGSWAIGNGDVRLLAKDVVVYPEQDKLVLAMRTNLELSTNAHLDLRAPHPDGAPMAVTMHPELFLAMSHRMLAEGQIPRRYNENGAADEKGAYAVTLNTMVGNAAGLERLDSRFRVWRIAEGYCGWAEADMPLLLAVDDARKGFTVTPGDAALVPGDEDCEGAGCVAKEEEEIVEQNQALISTFKDSLAEQVGQTINYDAIDLEGNTIVFGVIDLEVTPDAINNYLDFVVVQTAE
jgi:hypothetical protein